MLRRLMRDFARRRSLARKSGQGGASRSSAPPPPSSCPWKEEENPVGNTHAAAAAADYDDDDNNDADDFDAGKEASAEGAAGLAGKAAKQAGRPVEEPGNSDGGAVGVGGSGYPLPPTTMSCCCGRRRHSRSNHMCSARRARPMVAHLAGASASSRRRVRPSVCAPDRARALTPSHRPLTRSPASCFP